MASWNDFFGDNIHNYNNQVPAVWMTLNDENILNYNNQVPAAWMTLNDENIHNYSNQVPAWMTLNYGTGATQVLRYPAHDQSNYHVYSPWPADNSEDALSVNTVVLKVPICCEGCEERVKSRLIDINGVQGVHCDQLQHKVTVTGTASPDEILNECKKLLKRSNWWPSH